MPNVTHTSVSDPAPAPAGRPVILPAECPPHPSTYLSPERLAEFWQEIERLAALQGLPPLPIPQ